MTIGTSFTPEQYKKRKVALITGKMPLIDFDNNLISDNRDHGSGWFILDRTVVGKRVRSPWDH
jgi:hypothetical protein